MRLGLIGVCAASLAGAVAAAPRRNALPCTDEGGEPVQVAAVGADFGVTLVDGRILRLAGIDPVRPTSARPDVEQARATLASWIAGQTVILRSLSASPDRWGRLPALLFAEAVPAAVQARLSAAGQDPPVLSVGLAMVEAGLARAHPEPEAHDCWPALTHAETKARAAGLGLWGDPYYAVRDAADIASLETATGSMAVVQGRVSRIGQGRSRLFIGFGKRGSDFELHLSKRDLFILAELGLDQAKLSGVAVRARGYLDDRFGPSIDVTEADQVEVLSRPEAGGGEQAAAANR